MTDSIKEELSRLMNEIMEKNNLSTYLIEENAKRAGLNITQSYAARIKNKKAGNLSVPIQKALAVGLGIEPQVVFDIVNGVKRKPGSFTEEILEAVRPAEKFHEQLRNDLLQTIKRMVFALKAENASITEKQEKQEKDDIGIAVENFKFISSKNKKSA